MAEGNVTEAARQEVEELLDAARSAPTADERAAKLSAARKILNQPRGESLLPDFSQAFVEFVAQGEPPVQLCIAEFCEDVARLSPLLIEETSFALVIVLEEADDVAVPKRALRSAATVTRCALQVLSLDAKESIEAGDTLAEAVSSVCDAAVKLCDHGNEGVRVAAVKFVEAHTLVLASAAREFKAPVHPDVHVVPTIAPQSYWGERLGMLEADADALFAALAERLLGRQRSRQVLGALVGAMTQLARLRPHLAGDACEALLAFHRSSFAAMPPADRSAVRTALKAAYLGVLRAGTAPLYVDALVDALAELDVGGMQSDTARKVGEKRRADESIAIPGSDKAPSAKRFRSSTPLSDFSSLSERQQQALVQAALQHLADAAPGAAPAIGDDPERASALQALVPLLQRTLALMQAGDGEAGDGSSFAPLSLELDIPKLTPAVARTLVRGCLARSLRIVTGAEGQERTQQHQQRRRETGAKGAEAVQRALVARLASALASDSAEFNDVLAQVVSVLETRMALALEWLAREFAEAAILRADERSAGAAALERYDVLLMGVLEGASTTLAANASILRDFVLAVPRLPEDALAFVAAMAEDPESVDVAVGALLAVAEHRPRSRGTALEHLLAATINTDAVIRDAAVRAVARLAQRVAAAKDTILAFAAARLAELGDHVADRKAAAAIVIRLTPLPLALAESDTSVLDDIVSVYPKMEAPTKVALHAAMSDLIRTLGMRSEGILRIIRAYPAGVEPLVIHMITVLTEKGAPSMQLLGILRQLYFASDREAATNQEGDMEVEPATEPRGRHDARVIACILPSLRKQEILDELGRVVALPSTLQRTALVRLLTSTLPPVQPAELLVRLHTLPTSEAVTQRKILEAINVCLARRDVYKQQVLAVVLQRLVALDPIPLLFMRTAMQVLQMYPRITSFLMGLLASFVARGAFREPKLWHGFCMCCAMSQPHSFPVLLRLPRDKLLDFLREYPKLRPLLGSFASRQGGPEERRLGKEILDAVHAERERERREAEEAAKAAAEQAGADDGGGRGGESAAEGRGGESAAEGRGGESAAEGRESGSGAAGEDAGDEEMQDGGSAHVGTKNEREGENA